MMFSTAILSSLLAFGGVTGSNASPVQGSGHMPAAAVGVSLHHVQINGVSFLFDQGQDYSTTADDGSFVTTFTSHGGALTHEVVTTFDEDEHDAAWKARVHAERVAGLMAAFTPDKPVATK